MCFCTSHFLKKIDEVLANGILHKRVSKSCWKDCFAAWHISVDPWSDTSISSCLKYIYYNRKAYSLDPCNYLILTYASSVGLILISLKFFLINKFLCLSEYKICSPIHKLWMRCKPEMLSIICYLSKFY